MFLIPISRDDFSIAEFHQSAFVDFPVWILTQYGLKCSPFTSHPEGFSYLQSSELNKDSWTTWFHSLVASQHIGIRLWNESAYSLIRQQRQGINYVPLSIGGEPGFESAAGDIQVLYQRYYALVGKLSSNMIIRSTEVVSTEIDSHINLITPVDYWMGAESVKKELFTLWNRYRVTPRHRVHHFYDLCRLISEKRDTAMQINNTLQEVLNGRERILMFNLINYEKNVFTIVDSSIVIGLNNEPFHLPTLVDLLAESTQAFIESSDSYFLE